MAKIPEGVELQPTVAAIYRSHEESYESRPGLRLGCGSAGDPCARASWYRFRWFSHEVFPGRLIRRFRTGDREEERMISELRALGISVVDKTKAARLIPDLQPLVEGVEDNPARPQIPVAGCGGHLFGYLDGLALGLLEAPKTWHVLELKAMNAKRWRELCRKGLEAAQPKHYAQVQLYMELTGLRRAFYLALNLDTEEMQSVRVKHDADYCRRLLELCRRIIFDDDPPPQVSTDPSSFACKFCPSLAVCHSGALPPRNCRTCMHSERLPEGEWACDYHGETISRPVQEIGCSDHRFNPFGINAEQVDVLPGFNIVYERDGKRWTDEGP